MGFINRDAERRDVFFGKLQARHSLSTQPAGPSTRQLTRCRGSTGSVGMTSRLDGFEVCGSGHSAAAGTVNNYRRPAMQARGV
jgi:hypothetical protein